MTIQNFLIGAGLGNAVGGVIGMIVLPFGWFTFLFFVVAVVGAVIYHITLSEKNNEKLG